MAQERENKGRKDNATVTHPGNHGSKKKFKDRKLRANMRKVHTQYKDAMEKVADSEMLLQEERGYVEAEGMERTFKFTQDQIKDAVDITTQQKRFDLRLEHFGPYAIDYTRNGRKLLIGGRKGHVATFDWRAGLLGCELNLNETVRDVKWLHNDQFFAAAQKKYVFIYDTQGTEIHKLKKHIEVTAMEFLPYHFLLATIGNAGWLKYQDVSTGALVSELRTGAVSTSTMTYNPQNAIIHLGHAKGNISLWSPNLSVPHVTIRAHVGPVRALAIDRGGRYMASAGADHTLKIWDLRNYKELHSYYAKPPINALDFSDTGLLAAGRSSHVDVWKDMFKSKQTAPYLTHLSEGSEVHDVQFCPFDDILGFGHDNGVSSLIVPGAGEANYDALEVNVYETAEQRRQNEVRALMNKLRPEMISLDPDMIGRVDSKAPTVRLKPGEAEELERQKTSEKLEPKNKARGKNSPFRRLHRKMTKNVIDQRKMRIEAIMRKERQMRQERAKQDKGLDTSERGVDVALSRFD